MGLYKDTFHIDFRNRIIDNFIEMVAEKGNVSPKLQTVKTLGGATLGGNRSVQMVKVGNSILVVGVGENVQLLKEINNETEIEEILQAYNQRIEQMVQPKDLLTKLTHVWKKLKQTAIFDQNSSFKEEFEKQLHEMKVQRKRFFKSI